MIVELKNKVKEIKTYDVVVSVLIATFNSEKLLKRTLEALVKQTYPRELLDIMIIDGGSKDGTLNLANEYGCRIINNPKTEPVNAKLIGMREAKGRYLITIDHDEVIENKYSIENKVRALIDNPECKVALCGGYKCPMDYPKLNQYISEFGDPFSLFVYRFPKGYVFFEQYLRKHYKIVSEIDIYSIISFEIMKNPPIFELCCLGTMIDRDYFLKFPNVLVDGSVFVHLFYLMIGDGVKNVAVIKDDPLVHYSADSFKRYFPKIKWRICNNIHFAEMGNSGFNGRSAFSSKVKYRKYLFIPYTVLIVPCMIEGIVLAVQRKNSVFLIHPLLCWYTLINIIIQYVIKILGIKPNMKSYDGKKTIRGDK